MVKRNLAKVETAGSSPVVRSKVRRVDDLCGGLAKRLGSGLQSRIDEFDSRTHLSFAWNPKHNGFRQMIQTRAVGAEVAHFPDTEGVTSSNLVSPTDAEVHFGVHWVIGAAASALPSHGRGRRFDSYITHGRYGGRFSGLWRSW